MHSAGDSAPGQLQDPIVFVGGFPEFIVRDRILTFMDEVFKELPAPNQKLILKTWARNGKTYCKVLWVYRSDVGNESVVYETA